MRTVLTIAGSDSIGGAGAQADLKAIASLDLHGSSVLTAITAQNTMHVAKIVPLNPKDILAQIDAVLDDVKVSAVKIGMLYSGEIARTVASRLKGEGLPLVVDPVLIAGVGDKLCSKGLLDVIKEELFPLATVVTPNRHEAEILTAMAIEDADAIGEACRTISELGSRSVLIKGGHFEGDRVVDILYHEGRTFELSAPRSPSKVHGAGCTLASYIAGNIAKGMDIKSAALDAKRRITDAIALSYPIGGGMNAINPLASKQKEALREERMEALRSSTMMLESCLPASSVPESGCDFVYSLPAPQGFSEVCGIDGSIIVRSKRPKRVGDIKFNIPSDLARAVLAINQFNPQLMSAITLRPTKRNLRRLMENGLIIEELERNGGTQGNGPVEWNIIKLKEQTGFVPDTIFDKRGMGMEPMMMIIGTSPADVLLKMKPIL